MHKFYLTKYSESTPYDITNYMNNITWSDDIDTVAETFTFDYAYNYTKYFKEINILAVGDIVSRYYNEKEISKYIIVTETIGINSINYSCIDFGWYLNNDILIQFYNNTASSCIEKILDKYDIKHNITYIPTIITKIYKDETIIDVIGDILGKATQELGMKYYVEMILDTLYITEQANKLINPSWILSDGTIVDINNLISSPSNTKSIEEMKNKIVVASQDENSTYILASESDTNSIAKYGLLQDMITVDDKERVKSYNIAKQQLKLQNKIQSDISIETLGHIDIKSGKRIIIDEPITKIQGTYLIKSVSNSLTNGIWKAGVTLEVL